MKITKHGVTITDVPGVESIVIDSGTAAITFTHLEGNPPLIYDLPALKELRDALSVAIRELEGVSGIASVRPDGPWDRAEEIPDDVDRVLDCQSDLWRRNSNSVSGWSCGAAQDISSYQPFKRP